MSKHEGILLSDSFDYKQQHSAVKTSFDLENFLEENKKEINNIVSSSLNDQHIDFDSDDIYSEIKALISKCVVSSKKKAFDELSNDNVDEKSFKTIFEKYSSTIDKYCFEQLLTFLKENYVSSYSFKELINEKSESLPLKIFAKLHQLYDQADNDLKQNLEKKGIKNVAAHVTGEDIAEHINESLINEFNKETLTKEEFNAIKAINIANVPMPEAMRDDQEFMYNATLIDTGMSAVGFDQGTFTMTTQQAVQKNQPEFVLGNKISKGSEDDYIEIYSRVVSCVETLLEDEQSNVKIQKRPSCSFFFSSKPKSNIESLKALVDFSDNDPKRFVKQLNAMLKSNSDPGKLLKIEIDSLKTYFKKGSPEVDIQKDLEKLGAAMAVIYDRANKSAPIMRA